MYKQSLSKQSELLNQYKKEINLNDLPSEAFENISNSLDLKDNIKLAQVNDRLNKEIKYYLSKKIKSGLKKLKTQIHANEISSEEQITKLCDLLNDLQNFYHQWRSLPLNSDETSLLEEMYVTTYAQLWQNNSEMFDSDTEQSRALFSKKSEQIEKLSNALTNLNNEIYANEKSELGSDKILITPVFENFTFEWGPDHAPPGTFAYCQVKNITFHNIMICEDYDFLKRATIIRCYISGRTTANPSNFYEANVDEQDLNDWVTEDWNGQGWLEREIDNGNDIKELQEKILKQKIKKQQHKKELQELRSEKTQLNARIEQLEEQNLQLKIENNQLRGKEVEILKKTPTNLTTPNVTSFLPKLTYRRLDESELSQDKQMLASTSSQQIANPFEAANPFSSSTSAISSFPSFEGSFQKKSNTESLFDSEFSSFETPLDLSLKKSSLYSTMQQNETFFTNRMDKQENQASTSGLQTHLFDSGMFSSSSSGLFSLAEYAPKNRLDLEKFPSNFCHEDSESDTESETEKTQFAKRLKLT